jgi:nucleotide-binding universal stress UspA family protein
VYRKILVANDGSPGAVRALTTALTVAKRDGAALHMVTVEELPWFPASIDEVDEEKAEANHRLAPLIEAARVQAQTAGVALETHLLPGHPVQTIVALVNEHHFDLLVVGFMGHTRSTNKSSAAPPSVWCAWRRAPSWWSSEWRCNRVDLARRSGMIYAGLLRESNPP